MLKPGYTSLDPEWLAPLRERIATEAPEVDLWISVDSAGHLAVDKIIVPRRLRNQGTGSRVMSLLTTEADEQGVTMALTPTREFGGSLYRLRAFYRRHGFSVNGGRTKDYTTRNAMIRRPAL
ncbi:GNAT family N-acetyltransferase [Streptomyces lunaelactis]|uniref:GNAT family N-acetyltransferase n=1 Tax=Streptomyces lunaelactis TaxID=1535768 RepID=UPI0015848B93|nr:GNAT family N-acetyltransferase [Streptomyces lunaelactis]NUK41823.1 GNAT family N-acetyltransferase [Streptomyces lunaelactis]